MCVMTGGTVPKDAKEAARLSRLLERQVEIDEDVQEEPCVPEGLLTLIETQTGRPCPRIDLDPDNQTPAQLVSLALMPHTRWLAAQALQSAIEPLVPEARAALVDRVAAALGSAAVVDKLYPKPKA